MLRAEKPDGPEDPYDHYTKCGETENRIKDLKAGLKARRLNCHRFVSNQSWLPLHAAAYRLLAVLSEKVGDRPCRTDVPGRPSSEARHR